jgi:C-terminal peptidase prc
MRKFSIITLGACLAFQSCIFQNEVKSESGTPEELEFKSAYNNLKNYYVYQEELKPIDNYSNSIPLLFESLKDPYTGYMNPAEAKAFEEEYSNPQVAGLVGVVMTTQNDTLKIARIMPNSPAQTADVRAGDLILKAQNQDVTGANIDKYASLTEGGVGKLVELELKRGDSIWTEKLTKAEVAVPSVWVDSIQPGISSIKLDIFLDVTLEEPKGDTTGTWKEFMQALQQTQSDQVTLLDLRSNPGGSVGQCLAIADEFVASGKTLIQILDRRGKVKTAQPVLAEAGGKAENRKFVVLANGGSASCSEILLSGLMDHRTDIPFVGDTTYGKGIGQSFHYTYLKGLTKITSLQFQNTSGNVYHAMGLIPKSEYQSQDPKVQDSLALVLAQQKMPRLRRGDAVISGNTRIPWPEIRPDPKFGGAWTR